MKTVLSNSLTLKSEWIGKNIAKLPHYRSNAAGGKAKDGKMIIIGGLNRNQEARRNVWLYQNGKWDTEMIPRMTIARSSHGCVIVNHKVYVFGGRNRNGHLIKSVEMLDLKNPQNGWIFVAPMQRARAPLAVGAVKGSNALYVFGSSEGQKATRSVERLDLSTNTWEYMPRMPPISHIDAIYGSAVVGSQIYLVGSKTNQKKKGSADTAIVFDPYASDWAQNKDVTLKFDRSSNVLTTAMKFVKVKDGDYLNEDIIGVRNGHNDTMVKINQEVGQATSGLGNTASSFSGIFSKVSTFVGTGLLITSIGTGVGVAVPKLIAGSSNGNNTIPISNNSTLLPTLVPTLGPTNAKTARPTRLPTMFPRPVSTFSPTARPTSLPTAGPTSLPTPVVPKLQPLDFDWSFFTGVPTVSNPIPTFSPTTKEPTLPPTVLPTTKNPTTAPIFSPTTKDPTFPPIVLPTTEKPTTKPTTTPSVEVTDRVLPTPLLEPSPSPSATPSFEPSFSPSVKPTSKPSSEPSSRPSQMTSFQPSLRPSEKPSPMPSRECGDSTCNPENQFCNDNLKCECITGWFSPSGMGGRCQNENECASSDLNDCDRKYANCIDLVGSYKCQCKEGYTGNGKSCFDIDECSDDDSVCDDGFVCINTNGSFLCKEESPMPLAASTRRPTRRPTVGAPLTESPTPKPTYGIPTASPAPTPIPSSSPTIAPSDWWDIAPTIAPSDWWDIAPTQFPTASPAPTPTPSSSPTARSPTIAPSDWWDIAPTQSPSIALSISPTRSPTNSPPEPTPRPTSSPTTSSYSPMPVPITKSAKNPRNCLDKGCRQ